MLLYMSLSWLLLRNLELRRLSRRGVIIFLGHRSLVHTRELSRFNLMHGDLIDMVRDIRKSNGADRLNPSTVTAFLDPAADDDSMVIDAGNDGR